MPLPAGARQFLPAEERPEAWRRWHAFRLARHAETEPDDEPQPDEVAEASLKRVQVMSDHFHFALEREGALVSTLFVSATRPGSAEYESNKHHVYAEIEVASDRRRQGLGASWLPTVVALARERGARLVSGAAWEEAGHAFARGLGAEAKLEDRESRLYLKDVDWDLMRSWAEREIPGLRYELYEPFPPRRVWEDYARDYTELEKHVPRDSLDVGEWILTPERLEADEEAHREQGLTRYVLVAEDGQGMAGITELLVSAHNPQVIEQELTAVHPRTRGHGLGKLLKARLLQHVVAQRPQARFVRTWNAESNGPMLAINVAMGFRPHRSWTEYQVPVEKLEGSP